MPKSIPINLKMKTNKKYAIKKDKSGLEVFLFFSK